MQKSHPTTQLSSLQICRRANELRALYLVDLFGWLKLFKPYIIVYAASREGKPFKPPAVSIGTLRLSACKLLGF